MLEYEKIKNLIKQGFDLELISFEFEILLEYVKKCQEEIEQSKKIEQSKLEKINSSIAARKSNFPKIEDLRKRYNELVMGNNNTKIIEVKPLTSEQIKQIEQITKQIEQKITRMSKHSKEENRKTARQILDEIKKISEYQLTIEQSEKLYGLIASKELNETVNTTILDWQAGYDNLYYRLRNEKSFIVLRLVKAIDIAQQQTDNIEELKVLNSKITPEITQNYEKITGGLRSRIFNKITRLTQENAIQRKYEVSASIEGIVTEIAAGKLDIIGANSIIEEEAKKRVESKPKTRFSLTQEQEKRQILMQIKMILREKSDKYYINNPYASIDILQELCGDELEQSLRTIATNLIESKDFKRAKHICDKYSSDKKMYRFIDVLRKEIRCAEIGDFVIRGLNMQKSPEEEEAYFRLIQRGLENSNLEMKSIPLGKSQDGQKNITLADIWGEETKGKRKE